MSHSWIKMRSDLHADPKVIAMVRLLFGDASRGDGCDVTRDVTVTSRSITARHKVVTHVTVSALLQVWAAVGRVIDDNNFHPCLTLPDLDMITGVDGFGEAMAEIGWVVPDEDEGGLYFINYTEFNTPTKARKKTAEKPSAQAERQRRYRQRQREKQQAGTTDNAPSQPSPRDASPLRHRDASHLPREEKSREEENRNKNNPPPPSELRPHSPANASEPIEGKAAAELAKLGVDRPNQAVAMAIRNGATLKDIQAICHVFSSKRGAWGPGALYERVKEFQEDIPPDKGWPPADPKWLLQQERGKRTEQAQQQARQREQERQDDQRVREDRERRYGPLLDDLSEQELRDLIRELIPDVAQKSHLDRLRRDGPDGYRKPGSYRRDLLQLWARSEEGNADAAA